MKGQTRKEQEEEERQEEVRDTRGAGDKWGKRERRQRGRAVLAGAFNGYTRRITDNERHLARGDDKTTLVAEAGCCHCGNLQSGREKSREEPRKSAKSHRYGVNLAARVLFGGLRRLSHLFGDFFGT